MPNVDLASHAAWLESKRRSRARRAEARKARRRTRGQRAGAILAAVSLTFATGGAVAQNKAGSNAASVQQAGSTVTALQSALGIPADGVYGAQTRAAVRRFQRSNGLAVDGIAGPVTLGALGLSGSAAGTDTSAPSESSGSGTLASIAACESGGDPTAVSPDGRYRGKYQFSLATWREMGGTGDPAQAPEAEQDRLAAALLAARGTRPWPVCGRS
ncbi:MAG: transglycosylase family protein [Solirubrobacteraceae bacterium]